MFHHILVSIAAACFATSVAAECASHVRSAARASFIPENVLHALVLMEAQRTGLAQPAPWTVSWHDTTLDFQTKEAAQEYLWSLLVGADVKVRVGCFGVTYQWVPGEAAVLDQVFDPAGNARLAADHLAQTRMETPDWAEALALYAIHDQGPVQRMGPLALTSQTPLPAPGARLATLTRRAPLALPNPDVALAWLSPDIAERVF